MNYDYIVVGSGAGGCAAAYYLAQSGHRVLLIERGPVLPRDGSTLDVGRVVRAGAFIDRETWVDRVGRELVPQERANLGGKTKWYGAALLRFTRDEFDADPSFRCPGWPIGYDELGPFYAAAEELLGVRAFAIEPDLQRIAEGLARHGRWEARPLPMGLSPSILDHPDEVRHFDAFASPRGLKADGQTALLARVFPGALLSVLTDKKVTALLAGGRGGREVRGVACDDGTLYHAERVLLAAGALHSPRLLHDYLARTGLVRRLPCHRQVGRNYKFHALTAVLAFSASVKTDALRKTMLLQHPDCPHSSVQPLGWFDGELFAAIAPRWVPRFASDLAGRRVYGFFLQTEDGSHPDNRVVPPASGHERPCLDHDPARTPATEEEHRQLTATLRRDLLRLGHFAVSRRIALDGSAHACGTLVAGADPETSVVDGDGRVHGMSNLYVVDGSVLPRSGRENPALTIYAWALRVASRLARGRGHREAESDAERTVRA